MLRLLIGAAFLALTGCWVGEGLYADSDARPVLAPGIYRMTAPRETPTEARIATRTDGMTAFSDRDGNELYGFIPLEPALGTFVGWTNSKDEMGAKGPVQFYFLVRKRPDGSLLIYLPTCSGPEAMLAQGAGATIEAGSPSSCHFATRASLEAALKKVHPTDEESAILAFERSQ